MENIAELDRTPARNYTLFLVVVVVVVCLSAVANLGDILEALGEKAVASFQKMTLKSKKMFKQWPTTLKAPWLATPRSHDCCASWLLCNGVCRRSCRVLGPRWRPSRPGVLCCIGNSTSLHEPTAVRKPSTTSPEAS